MLRAWASCWPQRCRAWRRCDWCGIPCAVASRHRGLDHAKPVATELDPLSFKTQDFIIVIPPPSSR
eukprot:6013230-Lingulodinium_polyedra.AAC.1